MDKKDREDYERGRRDREKGTVDQFLTDVTNNHPDTSAYYRGRRGDQLDSGKVKRKGE
jgi:hypothetical protein